MKTPNKASGDIGLLFTCFHRLLVTSRISCKQCYLTCRGFGWPNNSLNSFCVGWVYEFGGQSSSFAETHLQKLHKMGNRGQQIDLDDMICRILNVSASGCSLTKTVKESEIIALTHMAREVFMSQGSLLELESPVGMCGYIHGQFPDAIRLFDRAGFQPHANYLFLGDYVDRGKQNLEVICLFFCYKIKYPENFFLLRGNHECSAINRVYGFFEECNRRYQSTRMWQAFQDVFNTMPFCGLIASKILCMHGGLSPQLKSLDQLRNITRPVDPPNPSIHIDLLWSDPDQWTRGWQPNTRGVSYVFGQDVVNDMLQKLDIDLIARAHQVVQDGYEFFANRRLVTIFSAPHYCGQFDNSSAVLCITEDLTCSFIILRPTAKPLRLVNALSGQSR